MRIGILETALLQIILYALLWLADSYLGFMLSIIIATIAASILIISLILEVIEKSKVPKAYFKFMVTAFVCPLIVTLFFIAFYPDALVWMSE